MHFYATPHRLFILFTFYTKPLSWLRDYVVQWSLPIAVKLIVLIILCFGTVYILYEFLIKRFMLTRLLYGLKVGIKR